MRILSGLFVALVIIALPTVADAQFYDDFDSYDVNTGLIGWGLWTGWGGDPTVDAMVTDAQSDTSPHSIDLAPGGGPGGADVVVEFSGIAAGVWYAKTQSYIPTDHTGRTMFIMLNTYDGGAGIYDWSIQMGLSGDPAGAGVESLGGSDYANDPVLTTPIILDQWVEILAVIDLDSLTYDLFYGGTQLDDDSGWTINGSFEIQCIDLYCDACTTSYFDGVYLDTVVPVELQSLSME